MPIEDWRIKKGPPVQYREDEKEAIERWITNIVQINVVNKPEIWENVNLSGLSVNSDFKNLGPFQAHPDVVNGERQYMILHELHSLSITTSSGVTVDVEIPHEYKLLAILRRDRIN